MPRQARISPPGYVYHVMNRTAGRFRMLRKDADFEAFERVMVEAHEREPMPIFGYCLMGNHWHFVVRPEKAGQMSRFFRWLTLTHAMRWRVAHRSVGDGHLYGGRFKAFIVQEDIRLLEVLRYVERNALSAGLVDRAEFWRWSSLHRRSKGPKQLREILADWPVERPRRWLQYVNAAPGEDELARLELCQRREQPYGDASWSKTLIKKLGLQHTVRREGRPRKSPARSEN